MLPLLLACDPSAEPAGPADATFAIAPADVGEPLTTGEGFDPADGDALGLAFATALPVFGEGDLAWMVPVQVWAILQGDLVADNGICPYREVAGEGYAYTSNCRSSQGYEWTGTAAEAEWTDGTVARARLDFDLEVVGDAEGVAFDRIAVQGAAEHAVADDGTAHTDINLLVEVEGYWETRAPNDPRLAAWTRWVQSGSVEARAGEWHADLAVEVGSPAGLRFEGKLADEPACPVEVYGEASLGAGIVATFDGVEGCDACATVGDVPACAP